jgi:hypothetical protein
MRRNALEGDFSHNCCLQFGYFSWYAKSMQCFDHGQTKPIEGDANLFLFHRFLHF